MAHLRRFSSQIQRSPRRKTSWAVGPETGVSGAAQSLSATGSIGFTTGVVPTVSGLTLVRLRGEFLIGLQTAGSIGDGFHGAMGIGIASNAAFAAGIASLPTPLDEEEWNGWLYHRYFSLFANGIITTAGASLSSSQSHDVMAALRVEVDSKAMRKLNVEETMYGAIQVIEVGVSIVQFAFNSRTLVKLP